MIRSKFLAAGLLGLLILSGEARATSFTVQLSRGDSADALPGDGLCADAAGVCSFRAAIDEANALPGLDSITVSTGTTQIPTEIVISDDIDITGAGMRLTIINAAQRERLLHIQPGVRANIRDLTLALGHADDGGVVRNDGILGLERVRITRGIAIRGGALFNTGSLDAVDTELFQHIANGLDPRGGALFNSGTVRLDRVTITKGTAVGGIGGAVYNTGTIDAINSTFMKNAARMGSGGAITNLGTFRCTHCTIARNRATVVGGGILNQGGTVELRSTLLAHSTAAQDPDSANCGGDAVVSRGHNLESDFSCGLAAVGDLSGTEPTLRELTSFEGAPTLVAPLKSASSPAIDAADNATCPAVDQRLMPRPIGLGCDIGAFEHQAPAVTPAPPTASPTSTPTSIPGTPTQTPPSTSTPLPSGTPTQTATPSETTPPTITATPTSTRTPLPPGEYLVDMEASDTPDASPGDGICANADGLCSLQAAVDEANASPLRSTIRLGAGAAKIRSEIHVVGAIDFLGAGQRQSEIIGVHFVRVLRVAASASVLLQDMTLRNGVGDEGGVIFNEGELTINRCRIADGKAYRGAGLYNLGTVTATDTFFDGHTDMPPTGLGGCIHNRGRLTLNRVTLKRGQSRLGCGGGLYNAPTGIVDAVNTTIMRNRSRRARAGGLCNDGGIVRCTNCTIARNQANNTSGGILNIAGTIELQNTLVVDNWHAYYGRGGNCGGEPIISLGNNLDSADTCGFTGPGDLTQTTAPVRGLHLLGGHVPVGALATSDSPAIDAGNASACPAVDARNLPRPSGPSCDIGAYEYQMGE